MMIERARVEGDNENQRCEIERIVDKPLIEKADSVNKYADRRDGQTYQQITIPDALNHFRLSRQWLSTGA
jgi:hypothetical protein